MWIEEILIFVVLLSLIFLFREKVAGLFINIMYKISPDAVIEVSVSEAAYRIEVFTYIVIAIVVLLLLACLVLLWIGSVREKKEHIVQEEQERKE